MKKWSLSLAAGFGFAMATLGAAVAGTLPSIAVPMLGKPPAMNGVVDASWAGAAKLSLDTDFTYRRAAAEPTAVYVAQENGALDIAFVVTQHEAITATQHSNGSAVLSDDNVGVDFSPQGIKGFAYGFFANPHGARFQSSSENSAYAPGWTAHASITSSGYSVTMRIPLDIIRSGGSSTWKAQFQRQNVATGGTAVWAYSPVATGTSDPTFIGTLNDVGIAPTNSAGATKAAANSTRPKPRLQLYGLGEATTKANGGNTSRVGADLALPITPTASFVATLHPDYSNVEIDQQTISPSAFARYYSEVRPFFTQVGSSFNSHFSCNNCPTTLYTPSIPTFGQGYAVEGTQGYDNFAAFDAIGTQRNDQAETINYGFENPKDAVVVNAQSVGANIGGIHDVTSTLSVGYLNQHTHFGVYSNVGIDRGTLVTDPGQANYFEDGVDYIAPNTSAGIAYFRLGAQFSPLDGFVSQNDIMGYESFANKTITFGPKSTLHDIVLSNYYSRMNDHAGELAQAGFDPQINFDFRNLMTFHAFIGDAGVRTFNNELLPFDGSGFFLGYKANTGTPTSILYAGGPYYHGVLNSWSYLATLPVVRRVHLGLEADSTKYFSTFSGETNLTQWLERASLDFQMSKDAQFDVGMRRIIGENLPNAYEAPEFNMPGACAGNPYLPACYVNAGNVSLAFHFLAAHNEFYLVYGNPNNLTTEPALFFKWIRYIGAEKGT